MIESWGDDTFSRPGDVDRIARRLFYQRNPDDPVASAAGPSDLSALGGDADLFGIFVW